MSIRAAFNFWLIAFAVAPSLVIAAGEAGDASRPMVMGILPAVNAASQFARYAPLADYINSNLKIPVVLESAVDSTEFRKRTAGRMYDIVLTAPHFVIPALESGAYELVATPANKLTARVVVSRKSPVKKLADLAGKVIATPEVDALVTRAGVKLFEINGLTGANQPVYMAMNGQGAELQALAGKEADAAIVSLNRMSKAEQDAADLRTLAESEELPVIGIMVATDLPQQFKTDLQNLLLSMDKKPDGKKVLTQINFPGYTKATPAEYLPMRVYLTD